MTTCRRCGMPIVVTSTGGWGHPVDAKPYVAHIPVPAYPNPTPRSGAQELLPSSPPVAAGHPAPSIRRSRGEQAGAAAGSPCCMNLESCHREGGCPDPSHPKDHVIHAWMRRIAPESEAELREAFGK